MRTQDHCPSCGGSEHEVLHELIIKDKYAIPEKKLQHSNSYQRNYLLFRRILEQGIGFLTVTFHLCRNCGFIFFSPRPDDSDLAVKYAEIATTKETERREEAFALVDLRRRRAKQIAKRLRPFIAGPVTRALDIGGADGHCLAEFVESAKCEVLDFEEREMWPGVERVGCTLADLNTMDLYDIVLCNHLLEHVDDVNQFVTAIKSHLKTGGLLYVEVPLGCTGEIFSTGNVLTHLNFFSKASLSLLLQRNGFVVESCKAGPVLSKKRYVECITAFARSTTGERCFQPSMPIPYQKTKQEMISPSVKYQVLLSNLFLVLSQPISYAQAYWRQLRP